MSSGKVHYTRTFEFIFEDLDGLVEKLIAQSFEVTATLKLLVEELSKKVTEGTLTETEGRWTSMYLKSNVYDEKWWDSYPLELGGTAHAQQHIGPVNVRGRALASETEWNVVK